MAATPRCGALRASAHGGQPPCLVSPPGASSLRPGWSPPRRLRPRLRAGAGDDFKKSFLRRTEFDFMSLQEFRREALLQYSNTNQSEPLRIYISLFLALCSLCAPSFAANDAGPTYYLGAAAATLLFTFLFLRERGRRTAQLVRLQQEYSMGDLKVDILDPVTRASKSCEVQLLRGKQRVVALFGSATELREALAEAEGYRRRLEQSKVLVVTVLRTAVNTSAEEEDAFLAEPRRWIGQPAIAARWRRYFEDLLEGKADADRQLAWVALNLKGRVVGSNFGFPVWDELLAAMPPTTPPSSTEQAMRGMAPEEAALLQAQQRFYHALCAGDLAVMSNTFVREDDAELSAVLAADAEGRSNMSSWEAVLAPSARPQLRAAGCDAVLLSDTRAVTTCIEFPVMGPTLLATQRWARAGVEEPWRLQCHRTIPYATQVEARVALRCDHRGCIAFGKQLDSMR